MEPDAVALDRAVAQIVAVVQPLRINLFGSAARGEMHADSDLDLLVIVPDGAHRRRTAQELYRRMKGIGVPFDIIVATPADLERHRNNAGLIYRDILREGREIYAA